MTPCSETFAAAVPTLILLILKLDLLELMSLSGGVWDRDTSVTWESVVTAQKVDGTRSTAVCLQRSLLSCEQQGIETSSTAALASSASKNTHISVAIETYTSHYLKDFIPAKYNHNNFFQQSKQLILSHCKWYETTRASLVTMNNHTQISLRL